MNYVYLIRSEEKTYPSFYALSVPCICSPGPGVFCSTKAFFLVFARPELVLLVYVLSEPVLLVFILPKLVLVAFVLPELVVLLLLFYLSLSSLSGGVGSREARLSMDSFIVIDLE